MRGSLEKRLGFALLMALLGGCSLGQRGNEAIQYYDLGPNPGLSLWSSGGVAGAVAGKPAVSLGVEVVLPAWQDDGAIHYRLLYQNMAELRHYAQSRWVTAPSRLLAGQLAALLGVSSRHEKVVTPTACLLQVVLDETAQGFVLPGQSRLRWQGQVRVQDRQRTTLAVLPIQIEQAAPAADAAGGVAAWRLAGQQLAAQVATWQQGWGADVRQRCQGSPL